MPPPALEDDASQPASHLQRSRLLPARPGLIGEDAAAIIDYGSLLAEK